MADTKKASNHPLIDEINNAIKIFDIIKKENYIIDNLYKMASLLPNYIVSLWY